MDNERNEHFKGFAKLLIHDLATVHDEIGYRSAEDSEKLIAQRAYDLVKHATEHINKKAIYTEQPRFDAFMLAIVPDMTEWPKTASE